MENPKPFEFKPWMWVVLVIVLSLLVSGYDPVGNLVKSIFGKNADRWTSNIILIGFIIYVAVKKK
jgi:hypothetical protein